MARKAALKTSKIKRTTSGNLERYCRDLESWPRSWMGWGKDLPPGEKLVVCFRPFSAIPCVLGPIAPNHLAHAVARDCRASVQNPNSYKGRTAQGAEMCC
jgi:hypothetical protein